MPKSGSIYFFRFLFLKSSETIAEIEGYRTRIEAIVQIKMLSFKTDFHLWHTCIEYVITTCGQTASVFSKVPF